MNGSVIIIRISIGSFMIRVICVISLSMLPVLRIETG